MIPQSFIQELLNRLDIVDVVQHYLPLKKAGTNYAACCPFHNEKTPSFTVSPTKQFYHCFGCGAHGTAIGFLMEHQGMGFVEAVRELAGSAGLSVPAVEEREKRAEGGGEDLAEALGKAARYYRDELKRSDAAIAYLKGRGLTGEIAARFGLGYAPGGWQSLAVVFPDYQSKELLRAGLVIENESGRRYDRFRDRIMFPIRNQRGTVIGFGGRVLGEGEPKYLNSPETPLFEKGQELYGLFEARAAIRSAGRVLVVEGYMDVVALAQHGIEYAVATLGTAVTPAQVGKLMRQSDCLVFCFDGDEAGRRAAWRALENSLPLVSDGKHLSFLFLPQGEDPDSYVRKEGREGLERLLKEALPLSEFLLRELSAQADMQSQEGRAGFLQSAQPLLRQVKAPTLSLMLRKRLAELAGISQAELEELFQIKRAARSAPPRAARKPPASLHRKMLQWLLFKPELAHRVDSSALLDAGGEEMEALAVLLEFIGANPQVSYAAALLEQFRDTPQQRLLQQAAAEIMGWGEGFDIEAEFEGALRQLRENGRKRRVDGLLNRARAGDLSSEEKLELQQLLQSRSSG